jgi:hypothetical protein
MEISFWNVVKDAKSKDLLQTYLNRYPAGNFAELAKVLIEQLDREQNATRLAGERDTQARLAEAARIAAGAKQADESRKADALRRAEEENRTEALQRAEAEARAEAQRANDAMRKAEADRLVALKQAEEARREADAARAEQQRLAKLAAEASRTPTTVVAALPPATQPPATTKPVDDPPTDQVKLTRAVQTELKRVGCDPGEINGKWGNKSKDALRLFSRVTKHTLLTDGPTEAMLSALKNSEGRVCPLNCEPDERELNGRCVAKLPPKNFGHKVGAQGEAASKHQRESTTVDACISKCINEGKAWKGVSCKEKCRYGVTYGN